MLSIPTGKGKSRVIAAVIALAARYDAVSSFTIVYSSELLKSVDTAKYEHLGELLKINVQQVVFDLQLGLKDRVAEDNFLLIDEADFILLDGQL